MRKYREFWQYLVVDPAVCFGKLTFKGTRVPGADGITPGCRRGERRVRFEKLSTGRAGGGSGSC